MTFAVAGGTVQAWVAVVGGLVTAVLGLLEYARFRTRRARSASAGAAFAATVDALASGEEAKRLSGAILLRRFFDRSTEQGHKDAPYAQEAVAVIAALLRGVETGTFQKLLADGLAFAPAATHADLQGCNLQNAYLGSRPGRRPDFSGADFFQADCSGASLKEAEARGAVFYRAKLHGTVFRGAQLSDADFREADLHDAVFDRADLAGARFDGARNVPPEIERLLGNDGRVEALPGSGTARARS